MRAIAFDTVSFPPDCSSTGYIVAPINFPPHGTRKAIPKGALIEFRFGREPVAGSLCWLEHDVIATYGIGVSRKDVIAVAVACHVDYRGDDPRPRHKA
ncbi:MAG: hypothetical protein ABL897_08395 [Hyphomicrobium sp.]